MGAGSTSAPAVRAASGARSSGPTIDEIRSWPATVDPGTAARALGCSRSYAYDLVRRGEFPARVIEVGGKRRVITASILALLGAA
jgi:excisionase family DNA binding protein